MAVYALIIHDDVEHAFRLISKLPSGKILIHCEDKTIAHELNLLFEGDREVRFVDQKNINWGGFSIIKSVWELLNESLSILSKGEHVVLLSGHDYPLKPISEFEEYLVKSSFSQHIRYFGISADENRLRKFAKFHFWDLRIRKFRRDSVWWRINTMIIRGFGEIVNYFLVKKDLPEVYEVSMGSLWFALTKEAVEEMKDKRSKSFDRFFRYSFTPDESYFHTLIRATEYGKMTSDCGPAVVNFCDKNLMMNYTHICGNPSKWHNLDDWDELLAVRNFFFRKVRSTDGRLLLDKIDRELLNIL